jgi:hypothetical protein
MPIAKKYPKRFEIPVQATIEHMLVDITALHAGMTKSARSKVCNLLGAYYGGIWRALPAKEGEVPYFTCTPGKDAAGAPFNYGMGARTSVEGLLKGTSDLSKDDDAKIRRTASEALVQMGQIDVTGELAGL